LQAAKDLRAKSVLPVHSSKFALALHDWDEPLKKITELNRDNDFRLITPMIGEPVNLKDSNQTFSQWWVGIK
jgi:L-ascorbate metabolism protein UlaG (beta-lactamase superfamily)